MGRPIGTRLLQVVAVVNELGLCRASDVAERLPSIGIHNVSKYLLRGVSHGLIDVALSRHSRSKFIYSPLPGQATPKPMVEDEDDANLWVTRIHKPSAPHHLQSIWR